MSYTSVSGEQVNQVSQQLEDVFQQLDINDNHQQALILALIIMTLGKANGASKEELIESFENLMEDHYDSIESSYIT